MKNKLKIAIVGAGLAVAGATGVGTAFASNSAPSAPASVEAPSASDGVDAPGGANVQQGDQISPDTAATSSETAGTESPEAPGSESAAVSDGPGGYANPAGSNADNQQQGNN
ncbi:MAG: hypothetical protein NVS3B26_17420 [Mycobacteriales bacterium]